MTQCYKRQVRVYTKKKVTLPKSSVKLTGCKNISVSGILFYGNSVGDEVCFL